MPEVPQERSAEPNTNEPTVRGAAEDNVDPGEDLYDSENESPLYDTDDEEEERMAEEDEGRDDSSSSSDDDRTPLPAARGPSRQVPQTFINRGNEQPFRFFHSSATEEVEADSITYGVKKVFDHPLAVGRKFADKEALVRVVQEYNINENRPYKTTNSSKTMYVAECEQAPLCKWRLYADSKDKISFIIKTNPYQHSCEAIIGRRDHRQLTAKFLANVLYNAVAANPGISMRDLSSIVEVKFDQKPTYNKLWRAKEKAIAAAFGSWSEAYALLPNLLEAYARKNPGSRYVVQGDRISPTEHLFIRAAWSWGACREGFRHCRPVFGVDATFLTGRYKGKLLVATAYDANNQLLPFAYGLVDSEDDESWPWWMGWLRCNVIAPGVRYTVISDRHASIRNVFLRTDKGYCEARSEALHRFCARHISENVRKRFDKRSSELFEGTAHAKGIQRHHDAFDLLKEHNKRAWCYVYDIGKRGTRYERALANPRKDLWACSHDGGTNRWGIMTTNGPESLNKVYKDARALPVTALVDETFSKTLEWFADRRELARVNLASGKQWAPKVADKIQRRTRKSQAHKVKTVKLDELMFLVSGKEGKPGSEKRFKYNVKLFPSLHRSSCDCQKPDLTGIPCAHVIAVLSKRRYSTAEFVSCYYSAEYLYNTWAPLLMPFSTAEDYPNMGGPRYVPNPKKVKRGRRKHLRLPMTMDEMKKEKKKHSYRCSRCGEQGHTRNKCHVPFQYEEGAQAGRHSFSGTASNAHILNEFLPG
ncbi:MAG TPA: PMZ-type zinc finger domain-containing protein [Candidatus Saccharimonadales bacterium]|nr:PMZ-type zinc finger domain-containing protein [Candidatus Saccharimonadales bacterium]